MLRKKYVFLQAKVSSVVKIKFSSTCKAYWPVSDRRYVFIKQAKTFVDFGNNF